MSIAPDTSSMAARTPRAGAALGLAVYLCSIFLSAFLLFAIQPMFTRMVLPQLGGSPAVWSVAMVFFQGVLLLGYLYAHGLNTMLGRRRAVVAHLCVLAAAVAALPISLASGLGKPPADGEALWLIGVFAASVGLPFFAVSTNGPLLQAWFSNTGHPHARDPYFLYGASNLGSFSALLLYPLVTEPLLTLREQALAWSIGYGCLCAVIALCGVLLVRTTPGGRTIAAAEPATSIAVSRRLHWIALAFVPSALLIAVTAHIATDIASAPFLWVVPLALFLLSFVCVFRERPLLPHGWVLVLFPVCLAGLLFVETFKRTSLEGMLLANLGLLFLAALVCHRELYVRRPASSQLTMFYLHVSLGGVLGGIFASLVAPLVFSTVAEYPMLIVVACLCLPCRAGMDRSRMKNAGIALAVFCAACLAFIGAQALLPEQGTALMAAAFLGAASVIWLDRRVPERVALACTFVFFALAAINAQSENFSVRSFFGVKKISLSADRQFRILSHGNTIHGGIRIATSAGTPPDGRPRPSTYYSFGSPMSDAIAAARGVAGGTLGSVAVAGLGTGSIACFKQGSERWNLFEIDPQIVTLAKDPAIFRYLRDCDPDARIVVGDARLTLADEPGPFDVILLDAFSSDAIPVHLMTREAIEAYAGKLSAHGMIVLHISNRYIDLEPFVTAIADRLGLASLMRNQTVDQLRPQQVEDGATASTVIALARSRSDLGALLADADWADPAHDPSVRPWTDDYSNILGALRRGLSR